MYVPDMKSFEGLLSIVSWISEKQSQFCYCTLTQR